MTQPDTSLGQGSPLADPVLEPTKPPDNDILSGRSVSVNMDLRISADSLEAIDDPAGQDTTLRLSGIRIIYICIYICVYICIIHMY